MSNDLSMPSHLTVIDASRRSPSHVTHKHVEHRAPTDESVRLLREMEAEIKASMTAALRIEDAKFECILHCYTDGYADTQKYMVVFSLNGHNMTVEHETPRFPEKPWVPELIEKMAEKIAAEILRPALLKAMKDGEVRLTP